MDFSSCLSRGKFCLVKGYSSFKYAVCVLYTVIMKRHVPVLLMLLAVAFVLHTSTLAHAEIPNWIKTNAGWWAEGSISDADFLAGMSYLVSAGVIAVPPVVDPDHDGSTMGQTDSVPLWIKTNAGWWAEGSISDDDFLNGIQYLMQIGLVTVPASDIGHGGSNDDDNIAVDTTGTTDAVLAELESQLAECSTITKAYKRIDCEKPIEQAITLHTYRTNADVFSVGPINYYWFGLGSDGNSFEISPSGQALLSLRMLAENTSTELQSLDCTSPSLCSYDVWDGSDSFRYAGTDFTSGQIVLNPGDAREFNMLFGPNVGYGGSQFLYEESKTYHFRINESFGNAMIPLGLDKME